MSRTAINDQLIRMSQLSMAVQALAQERDTPLVRAAMKSLRDEWAECWLGVEEELRTEGKLP